MRMSVVWRENAEREVGEWVLNEKFNFYLICHRATYLVNLQTVVRAVPRPWSDY